MVKERKVILIIKKYVQFGNCSLNHVLKQSMIISNIKVVKLKERTEAVNLTIIPNYRYLGPVSLLSFFFQKFQNIPISLSGFY